MECFRRVPAADLGWRPVSLDLRYDREAWVAGLGSLPSEARRLGKWLAGYADGEGLFQVSNGYLRAAGREVGLSSGAVAEAFQRLQRAGMVERVRASDPLARVPTTYRLTMAATPVVVRSARDG